MKTLYLIRHAEAVRAGGELADRDRPLEARGERDAAVAGRRLAARGVAPGELRTSPALRALQTAGLFADALGVARASIVVDERIYASSAGLLLAVVQDLDDRVGTALLFGHNPEFSDLAWQLSGRFVDLPTCAVVELRFDAPAWAEIGRIAAASCVIERAGG